MPHFSSHLRGFPVPPHLLFVPLCSPALLFSALQTNWFDVTFEHQTIRSRFSNTNHKFNTVCLHVSVVRIVAPDEKPTIQSVVVVFETSFNWELFLVWGAHAWRVIVYIFKFQMRKTNGFFVWAKVKIFNLNIAKKCRS